MKRIFHLFAIWALSVTPALAKSSDKLTLGWIEPVLLDRKLGLELEAKLDTGADSSSLDARYIRRVRVGEKRYVRFFIADPETGELLEFRKPYLRRVRIKRHGGEYQRRYVVRMSVCIGGDTHSIDVNLIDREHFDYPMLLGRNALEGWAIIDPEKARTSQPTCWLEPDRKPAIDPASKPDDASDSGTSDIRNQPNTAADIDNAPIPNETNDSEGDEAETVEPE